MANSMILKINKYTPVFCKNKITDATDVQRANLNARLGTMAIRVVEFANGGYKVRKVFA
jgi:hypothetical protein